MWRRISTSASHNVRKGRHQAIASVLKIRHCFAQLQKFSKARSESCLFIQHVVEVMTFVFVFQSSFREPHWQYSFELQSMFLFFLFCKH